MASIKKLFFILAILCPSFLAAQNPWSSVLSSSRAINWGNVGAPNIEVIRTQCGSTIAAYGSSGSPVSASTINTALAACPYNGFVLLGPGTFYLSSAIFFPIGGSSSISCTTSCSNITLRGTGANSTFLIFSGAGSSGNCGGHSICAGSTDLNYWGGASNVANFTGASATSTVTAGTYTQGGTFLSLSSVTNLAVGAPLILDQIDDQGDNGGLYSGCEIGISVANGQPFGDSSGSCAPVALINGSERGSGNLTTIRGQQQIVNVVAITGSGPFTVQVSPGIYAPNWATGKTPQGWWATHPVYNDAVENLSQDITAITSSTNGITFFNCTGCWVKGVRSITTSSAGTGWYHVGFTICNKCTVRDSYHYGFTGDDYGFTVNIGSDILMENNIGQTPGEDFFIDSDCEGCVWTYNFSVNPLFTGNSAWMSQSSFFHGLSLYDLAEGNIGSGLYSDSFHGTHIFNTQFRNRWDGHEQNQGSVTSQSTVAIRLSAGSRFDNVIGNILGSPGYHTTYKALPGATSTTLYKSVIGVGLYPESNVNDGLSNPTTMYWGNWDNVTNAVRWCGDSSNTGWSTTCASTSEIPTTVNEGAVFNQQIGTGDGTTKIFSATLSNTSLVAGSSSAFKCITLNTSACGTLQKSVYANDTANGTFINSGSTSGALTGTINYSTGSVTLTFAAAPASGVGVWVNYMQQTSTSIPYSNTVPGTQTLPASFIYSTQPSWWTSGKVWPSIGPDVTGGDVGQCSGGTYSSSEVTSSQSSQCSTGGGTFTANTFTISNPAMDCYFNVMGGNANGTNGPLAFNPASCYSVSSSAPSAVTGLRAVGIIIN